MGELTLNFEDSKRILDNPAATADARVIAAAGVAFFLAVDHVDEIAPETKVIAHKLVRMIARALDGEA